MEYDNKPFVSVVMATFNEPSDFIRQSIKSILNQTYSKFELIIIDDSTNSDTISVIDELALDKRVIIIRNTKRIGFVKALNIGLRTARGKYIARMDGDDISSSQRFEKQVVFLEENMDYSIIGGAMNIIDNNGQIQSHRSYPTSSFKLKLWSTFRSPVSHPTIMMRREIVDKGYYYDESFKKSEDLEYWLRIMKNGFRIYNLPDTLLNFRVNKNMGSKRNNEHFIYNFKARYKNFSWGSPIISLLSMIISIVYILMPIYIINKIYAIENKRQM